MGIKGCLPKDGWLGLIFALSYERGGKWVVLQGLPHVTCSSGSLTVLLFSLASISSNFLVRCSASPAIVKGYSERGHVAAFSM